MNEDEVRILICGNTVWMDAGPIFDVMYYEAEDMSDRGNLTFVSGMAPGADIIAYYCSLALDVECDDYPANSFGQKKIQKIMGDDYTEMSRNQWMLDSGVDLCYAFAEDLTKLSGTQDMVNRCIDRGGIPIFWFNGEHMRNVTDGTRVTHITKHTALSSMPIVKGGE